ncbi:MAG: methyltransferase domain-containing protein [Infirmifilum sp.]
MTVRLSRDELQNIYRSIINNPSLVGPVAVSAGTPEYLKWVVEASGEKNTVFLVGPGSKAGLCYSIAELGGVESVCVDYTYLPLRDESISVLLFAFVFNAARDIKAMLSEARRVLKEKGVLIAGDWAPQSRIAPAIKEGFQLNLNEFKVYFSKYFRVVELRIYKDYFIVVGINEQPE